MVSYVQLESEPYWDREIITPELDWLGDELCRRTSRPRVAAGSKGDRFHLSGAHRSQEWILNSRFCTNRTYTVQSGLTAIQQRHIAGFDFTPGEWGSTANRTLMAQQTARLMAAMKAGLLDEVVELYGTLNGRTVSGWDNNRDRIVTSDTSHLDHWHLTIARWQLRNSALMARIVAIALGDQEDDDMPSEQVVAQEVLHDARYPRADAANRPEGERDISLASSAEWSRKHSADTKTMVGLQVIPMLAGIQASITGQDLAAAIHAAVHQSVMNLVPLLSDELGETVPTAQVEAAMRRVLGSLDNTGTSNASGAVSLDVTERD